MSAIGQLGVGCWFVHIIFLQVCGTTVTVLINVIERKFNNSCAIYGAIFMKCICVQDATFSSIDPDITQLCALRHHVKAVGGVKSN